MTRTSAKLNGRAPIPESIVHSLTSLIRRLRTVILVRGISATLATVVGTLLMVMAIDAGIVLFSQATRWLLTLVALGAAAFVAVYFLLLPLAKTFTLAGIARAIETRHPELQERLSSAVELLTSRDMPQIRGSEVLIAELVKQASRDAHRVQPAREITLRTARPFLIAAGATALVLAVLMALAPSQILRLLARAVAPYLNLPNISADQLTVIPGDTKLLEGTRLDVEASVANRSVRRAEFRRLGPHDHEKAHRMAALPDENGQIRRFTLTTGPVAESFRYRVHAGDAVSQYYNVFVAPLLKITRIDLRYEYPPYTGLERQTEQNVSGRISAPAGANVTVTATTNTRVSSGEVLVNGQATPIPPGDIRPGPGGESVCVFQLALAPENSGDWALRLTDEHGFQHTTDPRAIEVRPDSPPTVRIVAPENPELRAKPTDRLPIAYAADDDFGLSRADLLVSIDGRGREHVALPLDEEDSGRLLTGWTTLDLAALPLGGAMQVSFKICVADNLPEGLGGPQEAASELYTIQLDLAAEDLALQDLFRLEEDIRATLEKVLEELKAAKEDSVPLKQEAAKEGPLAETSHQRISNMLQHLGAADVAVRYLAEEVTWGYYQDLKPKLMALAEDPIAKAMDRTGQVPLLDVAEKRGQQAAEADTQIDRAIAATEELLKEFEQLVLAPHLPPDLEQLAREEVRLAELMAAMKAADAELGMTPEEWAKAQAELTDALGDIMRQMPEALAAAPGPAAERTKSLVEEILELKAQQETLAQVTGQRAEGEMGQSLIEQLQALQAQLAAETRQLASEAAGARSPAAPTGQQAAQSAQQAADQLQVPDLSPAAQSAQQAADQLGQTADQLAQQAIQQARQQIGQIGQITGQQAALAAEAAGQAAQAAGQAAEAAGQAAQQAGQQAGPQAALAVQQARQAAQQAAQAAQQAAQAAQQAGQMAGQEAVRAARQAGQAAQQAGRAAQQAAQAAQQAGKMAAEAEGQATQAAGQAAQAAGQAAQAAGQAVADQVAEMAGQQGGQQVGAMPQRAADLQQRQQVLADQIRALVQDDMAGAMGSQQAGIAARAGQLGQQTAALQQQVQAFSPAFGQQAAQAAEHMGQSAQSASQAASQIGAPPPAAMAGAQLAQQAAAQAMGQAADALSRLSDSLAAAARPAASQAGAKGGMGKGKGGMGKGKGGMGKGMAGAYSAASMAAASPSTPSAAMAASAMAAAAGQAAQQARLQAAQAAQQAGQAAQQAGQFASMAGQQVGKGGMGKGKGGMGKGTGQGAGHAAAAAGQAAQAAGQAASAVARMGGRMGRGTGRSMGGGGNRPGLSGNPQMGAGLMGIDGRAVRLLLRSGMRLSDWERLPSELRTRVLQAAEGGGPAEYRTLIKRYFQEVARRGSVAIPESEEQK